MNLGIRDAISLGPVLVEHLQRNEHGGDSHTRRDRHSTAEVGRMAPLDGCEGRRPREEHLVFCDVAGSYAVVLRCHTHQLGDSEESGAVGWGRADEEEGSLVVEWFDESLACDLAFVQYYPKFSSLDMMNSSRPSAQIDAPVNRSYMRHRVWDSHQKRAAVQFTRSR